MHQIIKNDQKLGQSVGSPENFGTRRVGRFTAEDEEEPLPVVLGVTLVLAQNLSQCLRDQLGLDNWTRSSHLAL